MRLRRPTAPGLETWRGGIACELAGLLRKRRRQVAVEQGEESLSYGALETHAAIMAGRLKQAGLGPGSVVGLYVDRTMDIVPAILGILRIGAAWLPLDPAYPPERTLRILSDSGAAAALTTRLLSRQLPGSDLPAVLIDDPVVPPPAPLEAVTPEALAYLIYTSGSTGRPKGVAVTHGNLCHYARAMAERLGLGPRDRYLHTASFAFSSSVRQVFAPLVAGARILIASREEIASPRGFLEMARVRRATVIDLVPSYWAQVVAAAGYDPSLLHGSSLRLALSASEPLPNRLVADWYTLTGRTTRFINMYGQTETTGIVSTAALSADAVLEDGIAPIGHPIPGTTMHILDEDDGIVAGDGVGEICIGGASVRAGYWQQPELTASRFIAHPDLGRIYRTGDLGARRPDGQFVFRGRSDGQIKIRGHRVEVEEIEAALLAHPAVGAAAVFGSVRDGEINLTALVVARGGRRPTVRDVRQHLKRVTPDYMIPATIRVVARLPRTANGKIDRAALPHVRITPTPRGGAEPAGETPTRTIPSLKDLGSIEGALARHEAVRQACLTLQPAAEGSRLTAYVVFEPGRTATGSELRRYLKDAVPDASPVQHVVELETLPVAPDGTLDREALPDPFADVEVSIAPRTSTERLIAEVWGQRLGIDGIGIHDNFIDIGGHSLAAMQTLAIIERLTGVRLQPRDMVYQTLEQVAAKCDARSGRNRRPS